MSVVDWEGIPLEKVPTRLQPKREGMECRIGGLIPAITSGRSDIKDV